VVIGLQESIIENVRKRRDSISGITITSEHI
jgi:hypothetical protein